MKKELWLRLRQYQFEDVVPTQLWDRVTEAFGGADASTRAFASKIARKHNWSTRYALRAIDEYRKFRTMEPITKEELGMIDFDELARRLTES